MKDGHPVREGREPVVGPRVCRAPLRDRRIHRVLRRYGVPEANTGRASRWRWRRRRRWRRRWRLWWWLWARRAAGAGVEGAIVGGRARQALLAVGDFESVADLRRDDVGVVLEAAELLLRQLDPSRHSRAAARKWYGGGRPGEDVFARGVGDQLADALRWRCALLADLPAEMLPLWALLGQP